VADITYIRTERGWLYLAAVLDLYSRKIVGWAMAPTMLAELVCTALQMAIVLRQPKPGLIVHTDRGSQRFLLNLKMERLWQRRYANPTEASADITHYIVAFHNTQRLQSTLGYRAPADYENAAA
jgi:transposase InsO family protein